MSPSKYDEDLFAHSTMTFGEHLEELRACLLKAVLGLTGGFIIGLFIGNYVVAFVQTPLVAALSKYYEAQAVELAKKKLDVMRSEGQVLPDDPETIAKFVTTNHLLPQQVFVDPDEVIRQLRHYDPKRFGQLPLAEKPPEKDNDKANEAEEVPKSAKDLIPLFLWHPTADDARTQSSSLSMPEPFVVYVKASLLAGFLLASPYIFLQIWTFVGAGLYPHEKRYVRVFLPFSLGLFLLGAATAFFFVFEPVLDFLLSFNRWMNINAEPRISDWLSFVLILPIGFGISFQLPLVMLFLERIGIFDVQAYWSKWRISVLVIAFLSMVLTPADPYSMMLMFIPLVFLYFFGILLCKYFPRKGSPFPETR